MTLSENRKNQDMHKDLILFHFTVLDIFSTYFDHKGKQKKLSNLC